MTDIQRVLFKLLTEVDEICVQNGIRYYLSESTALAAAQKMGFTDKNEIVHAEIAMRAQELIRFINAFNKLKPKDRTLESWLNNPDYTEFGARYVAEDTLFLDLPNSHTYSHYGFGVRITVIRDFPSSRIRSKFATIKETGWELTYKPDPDEISRKASLCKRSVMPQIKRAGGRDKFAVELFKELCRVYTNPHAEKVFIKHFRARRYHFSAECFGEPELASLENYTFPMPKKNEFLRTLYGSWKNKKLPGRRVTGWVVADTAIPYREYLEEIEKAGCSLEEYLAVREKAMKLRNDGDEKFKTIEHYWALLFRTGDRYDLYEKYEPMKEEILRLHDAGLYDELAAKLAPYKKLLDKNFKEGLGLCFDPEIFECMMDVLKKDGKEEYAEQVRALVPPEHFEPIVIKDYRDE